MAQQSHAVVTIGALYKIYAGGNDNDPLVAQIMEVKSKDNIHIGIIEDYNFYCHFVISKKCISKLEKGNHLKIKKYEIINNGKWTSKKIRILDAEYIEISQELPDAPKGWILQKKLASKCANLIAQYKHFGFEDYIKVLPALSISDPAYNTLIDLTAGLLCPDPLCVYNELIFR